MSKRNFTLLIIILIIIVIIILGFLYFRQTPITPENGGGGTNFFSQFNPFGKNKPAPPSVPTPPDTTPPPTTPETVEIKLLKISSMPIAGFAVFQKERFKEVPVITPTETEIPSITPATENTQPIIKSKTVAKPTPPPTEFIPALRYVARSNGNIYQTFADKVEERRFSTTIIPKVYEAYFGNKGESVVMRYLKPNDETIVTFAGTLPKELLGGDTNDNNEVKGVFLPENISDMSVSPDNSKIFYLLNTGGGVVGITSGFLGEKKVQIFDSPFTEWLSFWPNNKVVTLTTKPSANVPGYTYAIDPNKKDLIKILGDINGLTTLTSPNGKLILYGDNNLFLNVYDIGTRSVVPLTIKGMPEKCVWDKTNTFIYCAAPKLIDRASYPDAWYKGEVSFSDDLWKIDIQSGNGTLLLDPSTVVGGENLDSIKLALDEGENYLFFVNKKDSYLWEFKLK